jgi:hypothetical protein
LKNGFGNTFKVLDDQPTPHWGGATIAEGKRSEALGTRGMQRTNRVSGEDVFTGSIFQKPSGGKRNSMSLTVRRENLPARCEICHQTDLFDPETGNCLRCSALVLNSPLAQPVAGKIPQPEVGAIPAQNKRLTPRWFWFGYGLIMIELLLQSLDILEVIQLPKFGPIIGFLLSPFLHFFALYWILGIKNGRCPYCRSLYPQGLDKAEKNCLSCGSQIIP